MKDLIVLNKKKIEERFENDRSSLNWLLEQSTPTADVITPLLENAIDATVLQIESNERFNPFYVPNKELLLIHKEQCISSLLNKLNNENI